MRWCGRARGQRGSGAETKATTVAGRERHTRVRAEQKRAAEEEEGERRWKRERASNERLASLCESSAAEWAVAQSALNGATLIHGLVPLLVARFLSEPSRNHNHNPNLLVRRSFHISFYLYTRMNATRTVGPLAISLRSRSRTSRTPRAEPSPRSGRWGNRTRASACATAPIRCATASSQLPSSAGACLSPS